MSGEFARRGFVFQDLFLLRRVLDEAARQFGGDATLPNVRFAVEARTLRLENQNSPWDVLFLQGNECEVAEVKSGQIKREDRLIFWKRLRREAKTPHAFLITPALVIDPSSGENIDI